MKKSRIDGQPVKTGGDNANSTTNMYVRLPEMKTARMKTNRRQEISSDINRDTRHSATLSNETPESPALLLVRARTMELRESPDPTTPFLDTVEGEMSFFRSIMRARPIGLHRHFHVLSMRTAIHQDTGRYVSINDIWEKLRSCYNVDALESLVRDSAFCDGAYLFQLVTGRRGVRVARVRAFNPKCRRLALPLRQPLPAPLFSQRVCPSIRRSAGLHHLQPSCPRHGIFDLFFPFSAAAAHQRTAWEAARARRGGAGPEPRARGKRQQRAHA
jgi:hypothetical protein